MKLTAKIVPYSSVVGSSVALHDETGAVAAIVMVTVPRPSLDYKAVATPVIDTIAAAFAPIPDGQRWTLGEVITAGVAALAAQPVVVHEEAPTLPVQTWGVTVGVNGVDILTIETNCLSGVENISDYADTVRDCAHHLLAFIGEPAQPVGEAEDGESGLTSEYAEDSEPRGIV